MKSIFLTLFMSLTIHLACAQLALTPLYQPEIAKKANFTKKRMGNFGVMCYLGAGQFYRLSPSLDLENWLEENEFSMPASFNYWQFRLGFGLIFNNVLADFNFFYNRNLDYSQQPFWFGFEFDLGYALLKSNNFSVFLTGGLIFNSLTIDVRNNTPQSFLRFNLPYARCQLYQYSLGLTTAINFIGGNNGGLAWGVKFGLNWDWLISDWRYGYTVSTGTGRNRSTRFVGYNVPEVPNMAATGVFITLNLGLGFFD